METKTRSQSFRLAAHSDSGRIQWHIGRETAWKRKLKILAFVPIILLIIVGLSLFFTRYHRTISEVVSGNVIPEVNFHENEIIYDDQDVFCYARTSYIPIDHIPFKLENTDHNARHTRDTEQLTSYFKKIRHGIDSHLRTNRTNKHLVEYRSPHREDQNNMPLIDSNINDNNSSTENRFDGFTFWKEEVTKEEVRRTQAELMKRYMDNSADPCENFYQYACGNWIQHNKIPPDKAGYDTFEILRENLDAVLRDLLLEDEPNANMDQPMDLFPSNELDDSYESDDTISNYSFLNETTDPILKVKRMFWSCINEEVIQQRGVTPLLNLLEQLGGWPIIDPKWNESKFDWIWLAAQLKKYNNDVLFSQWIGPDIRNSDQYIIQVDQPTLGLPSREYFLDNSNMKYLEAYRVFMTTVVNLLGVPIVTAVDRVKEIIRFEIDLASILITPDERHNISNIYVRTTVGELQALVPQIEILRYLSLVMEQEVAPNEPIACFSLQYLQKLVVLLSKTPPRMISNYLLWRFIRHRVNNLDHRFLEAKERFYYFLYGREKAPPRWQMCVTQINSNMGMAIGNLFVRRHFDENSKNDTLYMTREIQQAFRDLLFNKSWLDNDTKNTARIKLDSMKLRIGYPKFILDKNELAERYLDIKIQSDHYFENTLSLLRHTIRVECRHLGTAVNKSVWSAAPAIVNAYYSRNKNQIMFPAGILQPPFYHKYFPRALNYGGIGVVIGHEITHGFDDKGRLFDQDGNLQRWWREESIKEFHKRAQCLINQYNSYTVPDIQVQMNGFITQGENIADNGGIKQAYKAYETWLSEHSNGDETLPGLNLSNTQLFYLNFAQIWCGMSRPEAARNKIKTAVHSPGQFRIIGTLSNTIDFAKAYNCPAESPMNPSNKCIVW